MTKEVILLKRTTNHNSYHRDIFQDYLREIGEFDLLTKEEEQRLADQIQSGDEYALHLLIESNLRLVVNIAKQFKRKDIPIHDLVQEGNLGLYRAAEKFQSSYGTKFSTYASWWIKQSMLRYIYDMSKTIKIPSNLFEELTKLHKAKYELFSDLSREATLEEISEYTNFDTEKIIFLLSINYDTFSLDTPISTDSDDMFLQDAIEDPHSLSPQEHIHHLDLKKQIEHVLTSLPEREAFILRKRFGLDNEQPQSLEEIGKELQITKERVRQLQVKALRFLRKSPTHKKIIDFFEEN